jgi:hypothetical protein
MKQVTKQLENRTNSSAIETHVGRVTNVSDDEDRRDIQDTTAIVNKPTAEQSSDK